MNVLSCDSMSHQCSLVNHSRKLVVKEVSRVKPRMARMSTKVEEMQEKRPLHYGRVDIFSQLTMSHLCSLVNHSKEFVVKENEVI